MFNVAPIDVQDWMFIFVATSPVILLGEGVRKIKKLYFKKVKK
jgi:hypothetical protein